MGSGQVSDATGSVQAADRIACRVAENGIAAVGEVAWQIPADAAEPYWIRLRLDAADQHVSDNEYQVKVRPADAEHPRRRWLGVLLREGENIRILAHAPGR